MAGEEVFGKLKAELPRTGGMLMLGTEWSCGEEHIFNACLSEISSSRTDQGSDLARYGTC